MKRYIVEWGSGVDIHGGNVTKAARLAVKDAMSHCCLCGISEILELADPGKMCVGIKIACPHPEIVDREAVLSEVSVGTGRIDEVIQGGMASTGMQNATMGAGDQIVIALAVLTVYLDV